MKQLSPSDQRAKKVRDIVALHRGNKDNALLVLKRDEISNAKLEGETSASHSTLKATILSDMEGNVRQLTAMREGTMGGFDATDICIGEFVRSKYGFSNLSEFMRVGLGIEPSQTKVVNLQSSPDFNFGYRWLLPELILAAVKTGIRKPPIYKSLVAQTATISQMDAKIPVINMADAMPTVIGEADTIPTGSFSFGQKQVNTFKVGTGIKVTDEAAKYITLDIMSAYFMDMPSKIDSAFDALALQTILLGNEAGEEIPVIGVSEIGKIQYRDLLRIWARGGRMGRQFVSMVCDEEEFIELMLLKEIYGYSAGTTKLNLTVESTIPSAAKSYVHSIIPTDCLAMIDPNASLLELNVEALSVESERIVNNGINATYVKMRKGFGKMWQDASVLLNKTVEYNKVAGQVGGFPTWMDPTKIELTMFKGRKVIG